MAVEGARQNKVQWYLYESKNTRTKAVPRDANYKFRKIYFKQNIID